jgi:hypothetical protein
LQDLEVNYFHAYIDGVDFVFIDAPLFRHRQGDIYGGSRQVKRYLFFYCHFGLLTALVISNDFCHCLLIGIWFSIFLTGNYEAHDFVLQSCCRGIFPFSTANRVTFLNIGNF